MSHIFVSYAWKDKEATDKIVQALEASGLEIWIDRKKLYPTAKLESEIFRGIEEADAFIFLWSHSSADSEMCKKEIEHATEHHKRIIVVRILETGKSKPPQPLTSHRLWIDCRAGEDDFDTAINKILDAINKDYEWINYHTKLEGKALDWERHKKDDSRLLWGKELQEAQRQLVKAGSNKDPQPTDLQKQFVSKSGKTELDRQKKVTRVVTGVSVIIFLLCALAGIGATIAYIQNNARATAQAGEEEKAQIGIARQLASQSTAMLHSQPQLSLLLAIEANKATIEKGYPQVPAAQDALLKALSITSGRSLGPIGEDTQKMIISPDNHWIAILGSKTLYLRDFTNLDSSVNPKILFVENDFYGFLYDIEFSPDSKWLALSGTDKMIRLWDLSKADFTVPTVTLSGHQNEVTDIAVSADNHWLASSSSDGTARLWDLTQRDITKPIHILQTEERLYHIDISPDQHWLVATSESNIFVWDFEDIQALPTKLSEPDWISEVIFSHNSQWMATTSPDKTILWNLGLSSPGGQNFVINDPGILDFIFTYDNKWFIASGKNHTRLWNLSNLNASPLSLEDARGPLAVSTDNHWLASEGPENTTLLWDLTLQNPSKASFVLRGHDRGIDDIVISSDNRWLVTGSSMIRFWDLTELSEAANPVVSSNENINWISLEAEKLAFFDGHQVYLYKLVDLISNGPPFAQIKLEIPIPGASNFEISQDARWLATFTGNTSDGSERKILLWDLLKPSNPPKEFSNIEFQIVSLAFSPDGKWLIADDAVIYYLWDLTSANPSESRFVLESGASAQFTISPNSRWLVTSGLASNQTDILWDLTASNPSTSFLYLSGRKDRSASIALSSDSKWLVIGSSDGLVRLWDLSKQKTEPTTLFCQGDGEIYEKDPNDPGMKPCLVNSSTGVSISNDSKWLATSGANMIRIWSLENPKPNPRTIHTNGIISEVIISPNNYWLAAGVSEGPVLLWNLTLESNEPIILRSGDEFYRNIVFSPDSNRLIAKDDEGSLYIWTLGTNELIEIACNTTGRNLTLNEWVLYFGEKPYRPTCPNLPVPTK